jgi:hypothetical protein
MALLPFLQCHFQKRLPRKPARHVEHPGRDLHLAAVAHFFDLLEGGGDAFRGRDVRADADGFAAGLFDFGDEGPVVGGVAAEEDDGVARFEGMSARG